MIDWREVTEKLWLARWALMGHESCAPQTDTEAAGFFRSRAAGLEDNAIPTMAVGANSSFALIPLSYRVPSGDLLPHTQLAGDPLSQGYWGIDLAHMPLESVVFRVSCEGTLHFYCFAHIAGDHRPYWHYSRLGLKEALQIAEDNIPV